MLIRRAGMAKWIICCAAELILITTVGADNVDISIVNSLEKIFKDTVSKTDTAKVLRFECATNEYETAQITIRSGTRLEGVSLRFTALASEGNGIRIPSENIQWNFIGFVPVKRNTSEAECGEHEYVPEGELLRKAPFDAPDPLLEERSLTIEPNQTQPVWITIYIPSGIPPGVYRGEATVITSAGNEAIPIELTVYPFELPKERHLYLTNWFEIGHLVKAHKVREFSEEFWKILERYAQNLSQHRQNVIFTPWQLVKVYIERNRDLSFDYSNFDRYVETFLKSGGVDRIELWHVAHYGEKGRAGKEIILHNVGAIDRKTGKKLLLSSDQGLAPLLEDLRGHLVKKGWFDKTIIHIADEPSFHNLEQWKTAARFVRQHMPGIKTIDAIGATGFGDLLDIMVPLTLNLNILFNEYKSAQAAGAELWFYTCCVPYGYYANRFLDYHLSKTRILHWMNYATGTQGFLHWGLTYDWDDPFGPAPTFPPGDSHIIYPGKNGPMNSIRWEMVREGLEDYEYLWLLESKSKLIKQQLGAGAKSYPADFRSKEICGKLVRSLTDYTTDPETFYSAKKLLAYEISEIDRSPLMLLATEPSTNTELATGPLVIKVYGVVEKGTKVTINGEEAEVNPYDGTFLIGVPLSKSDSVLKVEAALDGKKKILEREFKVK
jgi:hypothetical protein